MTTAYMGLGDAVVNDNAFSGALDGLFAGIGFLATVTILNWRLLMVVAAFLLFLLWKQNRQL